MVRLAVEIFRLRVAARSAGNCPGQDGGNLVPTTNTVYRSPGSADTTLGLRPPFRPLGTGKTRYTKRFRPSVPERLTHLGCCHHRSKN